MSFDLSHIEDLLEPLKSRLPEMQRRKIELREEVRRERQCVAVARKTGERCRAWAVYGNPGNTCYRHGGAETAKIPRSERMPACRCEAYNFPHRQRSGLCLFPERPVRKHSTPQGQRKYYKRRRKTKIKKWLAKLGL